MPASDFEGALRYLDKFGHPGTEVITDLLAFLCVMFHNANRDTGTAPLRVEDLLPRWKHHNAERREHARRRDKLTMVREAIDAVKKDGEKA